MLIFLIQYIRYYWRHRYAPIDSEDVYSDLAKTGIQILPNFYSSEEVNELIQAIEQKGEGYRPLVSGKENPNLNWRDYDLLASGLKVQEFVNRPEFEAAAKFYIGKHAFCSRAMLAQKNKFNQKKDGPTEYYHFDDWKHRFKVMIYLDDVSEKNSPFCYISRSFQRSFWKVWEDYKFYRDFDRSQPPEGGNTDWTAVYRGKVFDTLKRKFAWQELVCVAPKGSVILFDSRGLHRGLPLVEGHRRVIILHFKNDSKDGEAKVWKKRKTVDLV